ncbi:MAG: aminoglycoside phosphotransferase family protein [Roseiflexaceae bacterium]|nr:aminoglycoside phosphotransferase family protein [Roseiflexaceae bacterium]
MHSAELNPLPPALAVLVRSAMGAEPQQVAPAFGGFSNLTCTATIAGRRCVIKAATRPVKRADVRREAALLERLQPIGLACPVLLAFVEDADWSVAITAELPGQNGLRVLAEQPAQLPALFQELGCVLHTVHQAAPVASLHERRHAHAALSTLDGPAVLRDTLIASLSHPIWLRHPHGLLHGDIGLHNVIWDANALSLVDWEWAGLGPIALDLVWLRWTMRWRSLDDALWRVFWRSYTARGAVPALVPQETRALALGQIALILARAAQSAREEWLRRAAWTIALDDQALMLPV